MIFSISAILNVDENNQLKINFLKYFVAKKFYNISYD